MWRQINKTTEPDCYRLETDDVSIDLMASERNIWPDAWYVSIRSALFPHVSTHVRADTLEKAKRKAVDLAHGTLIEKRARLARNMEQLLEQA
ncbi:MAG: hypothetical protein HDQ88_05045 [Clostridia bacterium]|nr:hypothetical protein [Clostridia bacterium]